MRVGEGSRKDGLLKIRELNSKQLSDMHRYMIIHKREEKVLVFP